MVMSPFLSIANESDESVKSSLIQTVDEQSRYFSQSSNQSKDNFEVGGYHKVSNAWWEPTNPFIPTADDPDADGINSSIDSHPWNPHQPVLNPQNCSVGCEAEPVFSISDNGEILPFSESYITYSNIMDGELGDLDGDGDLDLVITAGNYVEFSENMMGEFQNPEDEQRYVYIGAAGFDIGTPKKVHTADLDADGDLDVIVGGDYGVGIIEMDGFGIVSKTVLINSSNNDGASLWTGLSIGDVNNDGLPDIAVSSKWRASSVRERINLFTNQYQGDGISFTKTWSRDVGFAFGIELADIDNDGYDDLVYSAIQYGQTGNYQYTPNIYIHQSGVDGPSIEPYNGWIFDGVTSSLGTIEGIETADLNNDGNLDLMVTSSFASFFLFNNGIGGLDVFPETYSPSNEYTTTICNENVAVCVEQIPLNAVVDLNKDGLNDVLWGNEILLNEGASSSSSANNFTELTQLEGDLFLAGDLTGNTVHDFVSITIGGPIAIFNQGGAILDNIIGGSISSPGAPSQAINSVGAVGDLSNDGKPDIVTASIYNTVGIHLNDGTGAFSQSPDWIFEVGYYPTSIEIGDINNDGLKDIVVAGATSIEIYWASSTSFFNSTNMKVIEAYGGGSYSWYDNILLEDFDGDGELEIAVDVLNNADTATGNVARIIEYDENTDSFGLAWTSNVSNSWEPEELKLVDLDGDGTKEFVRCLYSTVEVYNSSGSYFSTTPWITNSSGNGCIFFDATLDGKLDLLSIIGNVISVYLGPNFEYVVLSKSVYAAKIFDLHDIDQDGEVELVIGTSSNKKMRVHDINTGGIVGLTWEGGDYEDNRDFKIADFDGDGSSDILQMNYGTQWDIIFSVQDTDYDTVPDRDDKYINDPTQTTDSDDDGFGDNANGRLSDNCPYYWGDSVEDRRGCPDQDGDGWSDLGDDFWREPTQWKDTDADGFGDNYDASDGRLPHWPGMFIEDAMNSDPSPLDFDNDGFEDDGLSPVGFDDCPQQSGWSYEDRMGCLDTDWDGWSNNDGLWNQGDAFPNDISQWADTDGDGFGDNLNGTNGDKFPNDQCAAHDMDQDGIPDFIKPNCETTLIKDEDTDGDGFNNSMESLLGTNPNNPESKPLDYDGDGAADIVDAFPEDPSEHKDTDKDGIGDNADFCLEVGTNDSFIDCTRDRDNDGVNDLIDLFPTDESEWIDSDGDGVGDNSDGWHTDPDIWSDSDGDGWADQFGHILTDDCPSIPGSSSRFMMGCSDLDEDGMPDILDPDIDGDGITNDNELDASSGDLQFDIFDPDSFPPDIDGDSIPDLLDEDRDGDGFPDDMEKQRGSDYKDGNKTPFNIYGNQDTGLFYVPGEGFKSQYDSEGMEVSVSVVVDLITSELLLPIAMIPLSILLSTRKRRRYKKLKRKLGDCKDIDVLKEYESEIDKAIINKKVKVEHGMLLRNMFERVRDEIDEKEQVRLLGGKPPGGSGGMGGGPSLPGSGGMGRGPSLPGSRGPSTPQRGRY